MEPLRGRVAHARRHALNLEPEMWLDREHRVAPTAGTTPRRMSSSVHARVPGGLLASLATGAQRRSPQGRSTRPVSGPRAMGGSHARCKYSLRGAFEGLPHPEGRGRRILRPSLSG